MTMPIPLTRPGMVSAMLMRLRLRSRIGVDEGANFRSSMSTTGCRSILGHLGDVLIELLPSRSYRESCR